MYDIWETIREFLDRGGPVMLAIAIVVFVMWVFIIERVIYLATENRDSLRNDLGRWEARKDPASWASRAIYDADVSRLSLRTESGIDVIQTFAKLCPLLGLLGTVTGMIVIFDVMAIMGSSSPRAVAGGVARATMTTMAGMVGALSGIFPGAMLARYAKGQENSLQEHHLTAAQVARAIVPWMPGYARVAVSLVSAFFVTAALLFLMQTLIDTGKEAIIDHTSVNLVDFIRIKRVEEIETREQKPKKLMPEKKPETITQLPRADLDDGGIKIGMEIPDINVGGIGIGNKLGDYGVSDAEYMPIVRVVPLYPRKALVMGLEGFVIVSFTVTTTGSVKDVVVVQTTNNIFNRSAVRAAEKFKYKPRLVDGKPVEVYDVLTQLTFDIDDD